jgi:hypothetical protein
VIVGKLPRSSAERPGSVFRLTIDSPWCVPSSANILPAALNTSGWGPKGLEAVAPGLEAQ